MSEGYDNLNTGVLFKNNRKEKQTHPDYVGNIVLEDGEHWLNCWVKESKIGTKYFSLSIGRLKEPKAEDWQPQKKEAEPVQSEIPF